MCRRWQESTLRVSSIGWPNTANWALDLLEPVGMGTPSTVDTMQERAVDDFKITRRG